MTVLGSQESWDEVRWKARSEVEGIPPFTSPHLTFPLLTPGLSSLPSSLLTSPPLYTKFKVSAAVRIFLKQKAMLLYNLYFCCLTHCLWYFLLGKVLIHGNAGISRRLVPISPKVTKPLFYFLDFFKMHFYWSLKLTVVCVSFLSAALMIAFIMETYGLTYR